jgi:hypothetical protein
MMSTKNTIDILWILELLIHDGRTVLVEIKPAKETQPPKATR